MKRTWLSFAGNSKNCGTTRCKTGQWKLTLARLLLPHNATSSSNPSKSSICKCKSIHIPSRLCNMNGVSTVYLPAYWLLCSALASGNPSNPQIYNSNQIVFHYLTGTRQHATCPYQCNPMWFVKTIIFSVRILVWLGCTVCLIFFSNMDIHSPQWMNPNGLRWNWDCSCRTTIGPKVQVMHK